MEPVTRIVANALVRNGFAALIYDKRGAGRTTGDFSSALYRDFIADAASAVASLAVRDDTDAGHIGLLGSSENGWFTPEIAATTGRVAFILNRVGPPLSWVETVLREVRNEFRDAGVADSDLERLLDVTRRRWNFYIAAGLRPELAASAEREAINAELAALRARVPGADRVLPETLRPYDEGYYSAFAANSSYDPAPLLRMLDVPILYMFGEDDVNVPTQASAQFLAVVPPGTSKGHRHSGVSGRRAHAGRLARHSDGGIRAGLSGSRQIVVVGTTGGERARWGCSRTGPAMIAMGMTRTGHWFRKALAPRPSD